MATVPQIPPTNAPTLSYRTQRKFEMRSTAFSKDVDNAIKNWVYDQITARRKQLEKRHKNLIPEWRRIAEGRPREEKKSWPFENCSNLVHQVVGEAIDDLAARVMGLIWATAPIVVYRYFTKATGDQEAGHNAKKARLLEQAMDYFAYEPNELDLYDKENVWFSTSAKFGTAWICVVPEQRVEQVYVGYNDAAKGSDFEQATLYEGPRVLNLDDEDVLYDPAVDTPEDSDFFSRRCPLTKRKLQEREHRGLYKAGTVDKILKKPDRYGPNEPRKKEGKSKGLTHVEELNLAEWDIEECYFYWYHQKKKFRLIAWFHYETKTMMNCVFNFIPDNQIPIVRTRLSSSEKGMNGRGFADMGEHAQEEVSTAKNQRNDAITWGTLGINRMDPQNKNIDRNFKAFPGAMMPFGKDQFEHFDVGSPAFAGLSLQNEGAMLQQARERFGVGPAVAGTGAGQFDKKGRFGSMGTMAVLQDTNTRVGHRTSDFRHGHVKLFGLLGDFYGAMGLGRKGSLFGLDDDLLSEALQDWLERRVRIPIRAATASVNKEVTKQNEIFLNQQMELFTKTTSALLQAVMNSGVPEPYKKWLASVVRGRIRLMQQIIRDFQLSDQPEEFCPNVDFLENENDGKEKPGGNQPAAVPPGLDEMAKMLQQRRGSVVPGGDARVQESPGGPEGAAGRPPVQTGA